MDEAIKSYDALTNKQMMLKLIDVVENVNENMSSVKDEISVLKVNLGQNNVILKQHHSRSTKLETIVEAIKDAMAKITVKLEAINTNVNRIDKDLEPVEKHVKKVDRYLTIAEGVPLIFKLVFWLFVFTTSGYGCYNVVVNLLNKG